MEIISFLLGITANLSFFLYALTAFLILLFIKKQWSFIIWFIAGFLWSACHTYLLSTHNILPEKTVQNVYISGYIDSIPRVNQHKTEFEFLTDSINQRPQHMRILLSCYQTCPNFIAGDYYGLMVHLKKAHGLLNPGSFNYENYLQTRHILWLGYIKKVLMTQHSLHPSLLKIRSALATRLDNKGLSEETIGIAQALTLGLSTYISKNQWNLFSYTGTTHLMVISGGHIGLAATLTFLITQFFWRRTVLPLYCPAQQAAAVTALIIATLYTCITGFTAPTARALVACFVILSKYFINKKLNAWQAWRYGLLVTLIIEPHSALLPGFYFSFMAVAILMLTSNYCKKKPLVQLLLLQSACVIGLMPLTFHWFSYGACTGLVANLIAIPWVGYCIIPLAFLCLCPLPTSLSPVVFSLLDHTIQWLLTYLSWIDTFSFVNVHFNLSLLAAIMGTLALFIYCFMPHPLYRSLSATLICLLCLPKGLSIKPHHVQIDILDVGQGLSVLISTTHHHLLYDTGMAFLENDIGQLVIIPYLQTEHIHAIDGIIISHPDLDHRGGLASLTRYYTPAILFVNDKQAYEKYQTTYQQIITCHGQKPFTWDGVLFTFFRIPPHFLKRNNDSCVLQISTAHAQILLTGDIEAAAERYLVQTYGQHLKSSVLLVAHHGSKTSSTASFIQTVEPSIGIISAGFDNRYRFPHKETINTFKHYNKLLLNTADQGLIRVNLTPDTVKIKSYTGFSLSMNVCDNPNRCSKCEPNA